MASPCLDPVERDKATEAVPDGGWQTMTLGEVLEKTHTVNLCFSCASGIPKRPRRRNFIIIGAVRSRRRSAFGKFIPWSKRAAAKAPCAAKDKANYLDICFAIGFVYKVCQFLTVEIPHPSKIHAFPVSDLQFQAKKLDQSSSIFSLA